MIYLYGYLGIGVVVLVVVHALGLRKSAQEVRSFYEQLESVDPDRAKLSYRILRKVILPIVVSVLVIAGWPLAVCVSARNLLEDSSAMPPQPGFAVQRSHLLERLTVQEIEGREHVEDPLGAVPQLPFGHLNAAWQRFLAGRTDDAELWSFSARWETTWGHKELRHGYALVRAGAPGAYFMTVLKDIPDEP